MTHPLRTSRKYPPPSRRERWLLRFIAIFLGIPLFALIWATLALQIWRHLGAWLN